MQNLKGTAGFTGTQSGMTPLQTRAFSVLMLKLEPIRFYHGDCIGADSDAHTLMENQCPIEIFPPIINTKRAFRQGIIHAPKDYISRNHDIVDASNYLVATPKELNEVVRSGTWATIRYARKCKKPVFIVYPNGNVEESICL